MTGCQSCFIGNRYYLANFCYLLSLIEETSKKQQNDKIQARKTVYDSFTILQNVFGNIKKTNKFHATLTGANISRYTPTLQQL